MAKAIHDLDDLRRYLGEHAPFLGARSGRETGIEALDRLLAMGAGTGLPQGALTVLGGAPGSGRASLAAHVLARETSEGRPVAWIDVRRTLYPPALVQAGVELKRLLVVRTDAERAVYAAEQLAGSGAFRVVVLSGLEGHLGPQRTRRLQTAAESGETSALVLLDPEREPSLTSAALELRLERRPGGVMVTVKRDRMGPSGRRTFVPLEGSPREIAVAA
ncbi:MAG: hypothetical protein AAFU79_27545 [Myxococcota bacterium]